MENIKKTVRRTVLIAMMIWVLIIAYFFVSKFLLPEEFSVFEGESFSYRDGLLTVEKKPDAQQAVITASKGSSQTATVYLFDLIPIKNVRLQSIDQTYLIPGGMAFGVKLFTDGVVVVGFGSVVSDQKTYSPATSAGLKLGDIITTIDGKEVGGNSDIADIVELSEGEPLVVVFMRDDDRIMTKITPVQGEDGEYKIGMWVRDSSAGIGTVTYIDEQTGALGGLGHAITDIDTGEIMPIQSGEIVEAEITSIKKAKSGSPGELIGKFNSQNKYGALLENNETGIYGEYHQQFYDGAAMPIALRQEIEKGSAKIISTIDGEGPKTFDIEIESIRLSDNNPTKNMIIKVTDPELIEATGGIVQGMSGSPIIQDGKIVGAVTHVFVNDPTKGYGIFIENMLESAESID